MPPTLCPLHNISFHLCVFNTAILRGVEEASKGNAFICPAEDGGYVLLSLPAKTSPVSVFEGVEWSTENTMQSQIDCILKSGLQVEVGDTYCDIDDENDIRNHKVKQALQKELHSRTWEIISSSKYCA